MTTTSHHHRARRTGDTRTTLPSFMSVTRNTRNPGRWGGWAVRVPRTTLGPHQRNAPVKGDVLDVHRRDGSVRRVRVYRRHATQSACPRDIVLTFKNVPTGTPVTWTPWTRAITPDVTACRARMLTVLITLTTTATATTLLATLILRRK